MKKMQKGVSMVCKERGVIPPSQYFFFSPSPDFLKYNYGVVNCGHFFCRFGYRKERTGNAFPLLVYVKEGEFYLEYEQKEYVGTAGDVILINCSRPHCYYVKKDCEFYYFHFTGKDAREATEELIENSGTPVFRPGKKEEIYQEIHRLISRLFYEQEATDVELSCMAYRCLCVLHASGDAFMTEGPEDDGLASRTAAYIRNNFSHSFTVEELAKNVNLSPYYFAHLFKKETGLSPVEYAAMTKINYAQNILKTTATPIGEIAEMLGYSSGASFINAFKKRVGMPPSRFRKEGF